MSKSYTLNYFTALGIGEIWSHTIKTYPITVKAITFEEAVPKLLKKASNARKYNNCFREEGRVPIIEREGKCERIGVFWLEDKSVVWEEEKIYGGFLTFDDVRISSHILPTTKWKWADNDWIKKYCCDTKFTGYKQAFEYVWEHYNYESLFGLSIQENHNKFFFKQIKEKLKNGVIPDDEKEEVLKLLKSKELCQKEK